MIEGIKLQFTTEELQRHFLELADWWEAQGHRAADIILSCRHAHTEAELASATKQAKNIMGRGELWRKYARQLPTNEVFRFAMSELEIIQWPTLPTSEVPEEEFTKALFYNREAETKAAVDRIMASLGIPTETSRAGTSGGKGFLS